MRRIFLTALFASLVSSIALRADKPDYPGIWGIWGPPLSREGRPWCKGHGVTVDWRDIEPEDNRFDWSTLDAAIADATSKDLHVMVMVYTGMKSPAWLYAAGVPRVTTNFHGESHFPYYLDPNFKRYFKCMIDRFAEHLDRELSPATRRQIIAVQCPVGASGDPHPYKVDGVKGSGQVGAWGSGTTKIERTEWIAYQKEMFAHYYAAFSRVKPIIHCLFNSNSDEELHAWALKSFPGMWVKTARIGDRYQNNEIEVRVVYFDEGRGKWALKYDAVSNPQKTALEVTKTNSGRWKEARVTLRDGAFENRGLRGADLMLVNLDGENDTFHLIELTRKTGDRKGFWGE